MKKKILSKKAKVTLKRMRKTRQIDSDNLREVIIAKAKWAEAELKKGKANLKNIQTQINRIEGIILFCKDLIAPQKEEKE